jgi:hypothetical protein
MSKCSNERPDPANLEPKTSSTHAGRGDPHARGSVAAGRAAPGPRVVGKVRRHSIVIALASERADFIRLLRTGEEPDGELLQVMPWPVYGKMTRRDLAAVYAYLSAIPSCGADP